MPPWCRATKRVALAVTVSMGCAAPAALDSTGSSGRTAQHAGPARRAEPWPMLEQAPQWPAAVGAPFASHGHAPPRYLATPRLPPEHRARYEAMVVGAKMPEGFVVAVWHTERQTGAAGPIYAMLKGASGWDFMAMTPDGRPVPDAQPALCARCHAEALADSLFGPPRPSPPEDDATRQP